jgi:hypothetical protein
MWGDSVHVDPSKGTGPLSTLAFRQNNMTPCNPTSGTYWEGECANQENSSYVEDPGYETKVVIDDPACGNTFRNQLTDGSEGCFIGITDSWGSDLPAPYPDTTLFDPGSKFNASIGSADAGAINAGTMYVTQISFASSGNPQMTPAIGVQPRVRHTGSITSNLENNPLCLEYFSLNPYCFFGMDTASVGGDSQIFFSLP